MQPLIQRLTKLLPTKKKKIITAVLIFLLLLTIGSISIQLYISSSTPKDKKIYQVIPKNAKYVPNQIIVTYQDGFSPEDLQKKAEEEKRDGVVGSLQNSAKIIIGQQTATEELKKLNAKLEAIGVISQKKVYDSEDPLLKNDYILYLKQGSDVRKVRQIIDKLPETITSSPNYIYTVQDMSNDPLAVTNQWGLAKIDAPDAWDITKGLQSITVAVIDTGIDTSNPDTDSHIVVGPNYSSDPYVVDKHGHGTHVSGIIGAATNNGIGIAGVDWYVTLLEIKSMDSQGRGSSLTIRQGIQYAADNGARVISISDTGENPCDYFTQKAIDYSVQKGAIVVVAAGNSQTDARNYSPGNCNNVITVGATDQVDQRALFSNYGPNVTISAPGVDIVSTKSSVCNPKLCSPSNVIDSNFVSVSGTSQATPFVSGVVALLLSKYPNLTLDTVRKCLVDNADQIPSVLSIGPRLNAYKALKNCQNPSNTPTLSLTTTPTEGAGGKFSFFGTVAYDANYNRKLDSGDTPIQGASVNLSGPEGVNAITDSQGKFEIPDLLPGQYSVTISINGQNISGLDPSMLLQAVNLSNSTCKNVSSSGQKGMETNFLIPPNLGASPTQGPVGGLSPGNPTGNLNGIIPVPSVFYTCRQNTMQRNENGRQIQMAYLDCSPK